MKERIYKVKAFMDSFKSEGFSNLCEPILECIPFHYEDEIWEFEIAIRKVKELPLDKDYAEVEITEIKTNSSPSDNNDFKKPCPKCNEQGYTLGGEKILGEYDKIWCEACKGQGFIKS